MATNLMSANSIHASLLKARISELEAQLNDAKSDLADARPKEPVNNHSVIRFTKYDQKYTFAAIRAYTDGLHRGVWFITQDGSRTSRQGHSPKTWDELLTFIGERNWNRVEVLS